MALSEGAGALGGVGCLAMGCWCSVGEWALSGSEGLLGSVTLLCMEDGGGD